MPTRMPLNELETKLATYTYPLDRSVLLEDAGELTIELADGETTLAGALENVSDEQFDSAAELQATIYSGLPRRAVGEPYQSEGEG